MTVNRMGFGAMRITGQGIWGAPASSRTRWSAHAVWFLLLLEHGTFPLSVYVQQYERSL
jgi:hypothetical protein